MSQIRHNGSEIILAKLNGTILYEKQEEDLGYCIEYTVDNTSTKALNGGDSYSNYKYGLPRIYSNETTYSYNKYTKIEITLLDGTKTTNTSTLCSNVTKVRIWYPESTVAIKFYGDTGYKPVVKTVTYCKTDNFTDMGSMFYYCQSLTSLDISNWDTSNVTNMDWMFYYCKKLTSLDLSSFNTNKVTDMSGMFKSCSNLMELDIRNFNMNKIAYNNSTGTYSYQCEEMFSSCSYITELRLDNCNKNTITMIADKKTGYTLNTNLATSNVGVDRNVYLKQSNWSSSEFKTNWVINYVEE